MRIPDFVPVSALLAALLFSLSGCDWMKKKDPPNMKTEAQIAAERREKLQQACASGATYDRLRELVFDEAIRIRNADPANLDTLATHSVVRMERPVVKSRDEELNVTVCAGRFILELPPGAERGFGGERRITAEIEYAAQAAVDGSGLVYQIRGAEPIIYKLAAFDLQGQPYRPPVPREPTRMAEATPLPPSSATVPEPRLAPARPSRPQAELPAPLPRPRPEPQDVQPRKAAQLAPGTAKPSFNCRYAKSRSEKLVCANGSLAALDRNMSSLFYSALSGSDSATRAELRRSRDRFLNYRERCSSSECVADAYRGRMQEIRDIAAGAE